MHFFQQHIRQNKGFLLIVFSLFFIVHSNAQISNDKNYVTTVDLKKPGVKDIVSVNALPPQSKVVKVEYLDGLGRSVQTVMLNSNELGVDLVLPKKYDDLGRVAKNYLPYATVSGSMGSFRNNWESEQLSFYQNNSPTILPNDLPDNNPFEVSVFEQSPLNRVKKTLAPGNAWAGTYGSATEISLKNDISMYNPTNELVKCWVINTGSLPSISAYEYRAQDLMKNKITDENGKMIEEYKDRYGNTILKKVQLENSLGIGDPHVGWLSTYYIYDDLNRLKFVLPPKATEYLRNHGWVLNQALIDELCFWYEYDDRGRLLTKHVPGAKPINMVYDRRDRLVFSQDGNMFNQQQWLMTIYDFLNRPISTAIWSSSYSRSVLQSFVDADNFMNAEEAVSILGDNLIISGKPNFVNISNLDILTLNFYDSYQNSLALLPNSSFFPNYSLPYLSGQVTPAGDYPSDAIMNNTVTGKVTATKVKILDAGAVINNNPYLFSVNYYDREYRQIQTVKQNLNWSTYTTPFEYPISVTTTQFDFNGKVLGNQVVAGPYGAGDFSVVTKNILDISGKTTQIYKGANSTVVNKLIVTNQFDKLGRLRTKTTGNGTICQNIQDYTYNIRGWLRGVNMNYLNDNILTSNQRYFGYELGYNTLTSGGILPIPQLNGNIGSMVWASAGKAGRDALGIWSPIPSGAGIKRKYDYTYDNTNRLKRADFTEYKGFWINSEKDFSVGGDDIGGGIRYDENGNILSMNQMGVKGTTVQAIDILQYSYLNDGNSNRLKAVHDVVNDPSSDLGDFKEKNLGSSSQDYTYDDNGSLTTDLNKHIKVVGSAAPAISYNYLNLPQTIQVLNDKGLFNKGNIKFVYDALGNKLRKEVTDNSTLPNPTVTRTCYVDGFIYTYQIGSGISQIATEEGRIRYAIQPGGTGEYKYDWFIKDHLGNTRMVLTEENTPSPLKPYLATFEDKPTQKVGKDAIALEKELFGEDLLSAVRSPLPTELQEKDPENKRCALLKPGNTNGKVPYKILKIAAGDKFNIAVQYYYRQQSVETDGKNVREDILRNLLSGILGIGSNKTIQDKASVGMQKDMMSGIYSNENAIQSFTNSGDDNDKAIAKRPKAYLNYALLDTAMKFVKGGALRVGEMDAKNPEWKSLALNDITATQPGYILVYISNEGQATSDINASNVYFDNMVVITNEGPVMEEDHYYPFGLLIQPISTTGSGRLTNMYKYQGQEFDNDLELGYYEYKFRNDDPQIGRFVQLDPLSEKYDYNSTYAFSENKVTNNVELEGLESAPPPSSNYWYIGHFENFGYVGTTLERPIENVPAAIGNAVITFANLGVDLWNSGVKTVQDTREGNYWQNLGNDFSYLGKNISNWWYHSDNTYNTINYVLKTPAKQQLNDFGTTLNDPRTLEKGLTYVIPVTRFNKIAATAYLNSIGKADLFQTIDGFSLRLGTKDFTYNSNPFAAGKSLWSTPESFSTPKQAFNSLALDYEGSRNAGNMKFSVNNFGFYVKGTAAAQGSTMGGGVQLLTTPLAFKTNLSYIPGSPFH